MLTMVLLFARDAASLRVLLNNFSVAVEATGLRINTEKSFTFSWFANNKKRKVFIYKIALLNHLLLNQISSSCVFPELQTGVHLIVLIAIQVWLF